MPLLTTLGASSAKAFRFSLTLWYDDGVPAQGVVFNLQEDSLYHNYRDGINLGYYTGPIYLDNLWQRILFGTLASINYPEPGRALVNGRYNLGDGLKWYYNGEIAEGYVQNLATYAIYTSGNNNFLLAPMSTLAGWHSFNQGADEGTISGEHNVDGQGNLWYVDGAIAGGHYKITGDNLWHTFLYGVDQGLLNDFEPGTSFAELILSENDNIILVFSGIPFTGNYYESSFPSEWRTQLGQTRETQIGQFGAFSFVGGSPTAVLTGEHIVAGGAISNRLALYRDGQNIMGVGISVIKYDDGVLYVYISSLETSDRYPITGSDVYAGFYPSVANMQLPVDTEITLLQYYLVLNGYLAEPGCRTLGNDVYCIGSDGLIQGWSKYNTFSNPAPSCTNCIPYSQS